MKVGLLGGSFDPVHIGHLQLARAALKQLRLDKVYFVLSPQSPFKKNQALTPVKKRKEWLSLALKSEKKFKVGTWELNQKGNSYTVDSLRWYHEQHPQDKIYFILGSDAWGGFSKWKQPHEILRLASMGIGLRPGQSKIKIPPSVRASVHVLKGTFPAISSTTLRNSLSERRYFHCLSVADLASELARKHGWDPRLAFEAGFLHDCAKEWTPKELIRYVKKNRMAVPNFDFIQRENPNLLHAYVGADVAKKEKWLTDPTALKAISAHTLGAHDMGVPEKILFVADFSSRDRDYPSAAKIRKEAFRNLQSAFRMTLAKKIRQSLKTSKPIHPFTIEVWNEMSSR